VAAGIAALAGLLVAGDALNTMDGTVTGPNPQFSDDMTTAEASVRKLAGFTFETLLVGHGEPITDGASELVAELAAGG
jgi:glyoxylase-like metal-dependent hydrolase (beta-lactamase superfamily II)